MTEKELENDIAKYRAMLYRLARGTVRSGGDCEDIVQEAFIKLYSHGGAFGDEGMKKAWLIRVTVNLCKSRNMLKWNRSRGEMPEEARGDSALSEELIDLRDALDELPSACRAVIHLYYYEGCSTGEIADILGISVTAVTTRLRRGREKLRKFLE